VLGLIACALLGAVSALFPFSGYPRLGRASISLTISANAASLGRPKRGNREAPRERRAFRSLDPADEARGGFAPKFDPVPELQNLLTNYVRSLRQVEDFQQPVGNRVRQEEDKIHEGQGSYHHRNHGLSLFPS
jgi:hypothetical protein